MTYIVDDINNKEKLDTSNSFVEVVYGNQIYKTWKVEFIRPYIVKFLKEIYPNSLIVREINKIDITIFDCTNNNQIPVEIQKTPIDGSYKNNKKYFQSTNFEQFIRKQIEDNIENYGKCLFFFDSEYLRYLQSDNVGKSISINMTWIVKLMKEKDFKVFTIKYDGSVIELTPKDFDFLKNVSQTCTLGYDNDERILNRNKLKIFHNVIKGYKFTQEEITKYENEFDNRDSNEYVKSSQYFRSCTDERCKLYGSILILFRSLLIINNILACNCNKHLVYTVMLGIFEQNDYRGNDRNARIQFTDKFDIAQYFPGYIKNKEMWDYCKNKPRVFSTEEFNGIISGSFNYDFIKRQSLLVDY